MHLAYPKNRKRHTCVADMPYAMLMEEISIGCGETVSMIFLSEHICTFRKLYPQMQFRIYSAIADDVKERIEKGLFDMGLLTEPVDISRYAFLRMPQKDRWGVPVPKEHPLAQKEGEDRCLRMPEEKRKEMPEEIHFQEQQLARLDFWRYQLRNGKKE